MKGILEKRKYESDFELWCRCYSNIKFLAHYHTDVEMIYVRDGNPQILVNNHLYSCAPGDLMIFKSGDIHYNENDQSATYLTLSSLIRLFSESFIPPKQNFPLA